MKAAFQRFLGRRFPPSLAARVAPLAFRRTHAFLYGELAAPASPRPNLLHITLDKAASQNTAKILARLSEECGYRSVWPSRYAFFSPVPYFSQLSDEFIAANPNMLPAKSLFVAAINRPVRNRALLAATRQILAVRDPRDVLVSLYYSTRDFHPEPIHDNKKDRFLARRQHARSTEIDNFVLDNVDIIKNDFDDYVRIGNNATCLATIRYEDFIGDFDGWLKRLETALDLPADPNRRDRLGSLAPRQTVRERRASKIRAGRAGQFREKLQPSTVAALERELAPILTAFGYT
jgi:hypothetical protein